MLDIRFNTAKSLWRIRLHYSVRSSCRTPSANGKSFSKQQPVVLQSPACMKPEGSFIVSLGEALCFWTPMSMERRYYRMLLTLVSKRGKDTELLSQSCICVGS